MTGQLPAALAIGAALAGILIVVVGLLGTPTPPRPDSGFDKAVRAVTGAGLPPAQRRRRRIIAGSAVVALAAGWLYTGIPTVGLVAGAVVWSAPWLFGAAGTEKRSIARLEAVELWTRRLADLVRSGGGLHQAILASTVDAPAPIAAEVSQLAGELSSDVSTWEALHAFADRFADPSCDEVVAALMLNARERGPRLADVLDKVATGIADLVTMRREVVASRTDARLSGQILAGLTLVGLVVLLVNKTYMKPYHTPAGQVVLAVCVSACAALLVWMRRLNTSRRLPRLLAPLPPARRGEPS